MNNTLTVEQIAERYTALFDEFRPYYQSVIDAGAHHFRFEYTRIDIAIDKADWKYSARVARLPATDDSYCITISIGLLTRLAIFINLLLRSVGTSNAMYIAAYESFYKKPREMGVYDFHIPPENEFVPEYRCLLFDCPTSAQQLTFLKEHWDHFFGESIFERHASIPVFWAIDFILFHEVSHIILRHLNPRLVDRAAIVENTHAPDSALATRRLMEAHADYVASQLCCARIPDLQRVAHGGENDDATRQAMLSLSFLVNAVFAFWSAQLRSLASHNSLMHPHPEFRARLFHIAIHDELLDGMPQTQRAWSDQVQRSKVALNQALGCVNLLQIAPSLLFCSTPTSEHGDEWSKVAEELFARFQNELSEFTKYMKHFL